MQDAGAQARTARQIEQVLRFTLPTERLDAAFNRLSLRIASRANRQLTLSLANRLFAAQLLPIKKAYRREITRNFDAPMAAVDFLGQPEAARKLINEWVSEQTAKRITELIPRKQITRKTMLVLVNAIYLKARWALPFKAQDTQDRRFTRLDGTRVKVPTMWQQASLPVAVTNDYTAVELPYRGDKLAMLVVMPPDGTFPRFERALDPAVLSKVIRTLDDHMTLLSLARFSIRTRLALAKTLEQMGITEAFDDDAADFYGIADVPLGHRPACTSPRSSTRRSSASARRARRPPPRRPSSTKEPPVDTKGSPSRPSIIRSCGSSATG